MGLDMYLRGSVLLDYNGNERKEIAKMIGLPDFEVKTVEVELGYWRKANHIHKWFVDNVQAGRDDCEDYPVTHSDLEILLNVCEQVLADPSRAKDLLPTQSGFFFGSQEYDDWYFDDIRDTIAIVKKVLDLNYKTIDMHYRSSW